MINYNHLLFFSKDWVKFLVTGTWRESLSLSSGPGPSLPPSLSPSLLFFPFLSLSSLCFFSSSSPSVLNHRQGVSQFLNSYCLTSECLGFLLASHNFLRSRKYCLLSYYEIFYLTLHLWISTIPYILLWWRGGEGHWKIYLWSSWSITSPKLSILHRFSTLTDPMC